MYYEITYNGDKNECYLDAYKKWQNVALKCSKRSTKWKDFVKIVGNYI